MKKPRCIMLVDQRRCHRRAARSMGDIFACASHGRITLAVLSDWLGPASRRALAYARWESAHEGQRVVDRLHKTRAVA